MSTEKKTIDLCLPSGTVPLVVMAVMTVLRCASQMMLLLLLHRWVVPSWVEVLMKPQQVSPH